MKSKQKGKKNQQEKAEAETKEIFQDNQPAQPTT